MAIAAPDNPFSCYKSSWQRNGPSNFSTFTAGVIRGSDGNMYTAVGNAVYRGSVLVYTFGGSNTRPSAYNDWFYGAYVVSYTALTGKIRFSVKVVGYNVVTATEVVITAFTVDATIAAMTTDYTLSSSSAGRASIDMKNGRGFAVVSGYSIGTYHYTGGPPSDPEDYYLYAGGAFCSGASFTLGTSSANPAYIGKMAEDTNGASAGDVILYTGANFCSAFDDVGFFAHSVRVYTVGSGWSGSTYYLRWKIEDLSTPTCTALTDSTAIPYCAGPGLHTKGETTTLYSYDEGTTWTLPATGAPLWFFGHDPTYWYVYIGTGYLAKVPKAGGTVTSAGSIISGSVYLSYSDKSFDDRGRDPAGTTYFPTGIFFSPAFGSGYGWGEIAIPVRGVD